MRSWEEDVLGRVTDQRVKKVWVALAIVVSGLGAAFGLNLRIERGATTLDVLTVRSALTQDQFDALRQGVVDTAARLSP